MDSLYLHSGVKYSQFLPTVSSRGIQKKGEKCFLRHPVSQNRNLIELTDNMFRRPFTRFQLHIHSF